MTKKYYKVITRDSVTEIVGAINKSMKEGWECLGGIQVATFSSKSTANFGILSTSAEYYQSMIINGEDLPEQDRQYLDEGQAWYEEQNNSFIS